VYITVNTVNYQISARIDNQNKCDIFDPMTLIKCSFYWRNLAAQSGDVLMA